MKTLSKQTISVILYSIKSLINQYCKKNANSKKVEDLLSAASCANSATNEFNKCNIKYIDSLLAAQNTKEDRVKIAQMCWFVIYFYFNYISGSIAFFRKKKKKFNTLNLSFD